MLPGIGILILFLCLLSQPEHRPAAPATRLWRLAPVLPTIVTSALLLPWTLGPSPSLFVAPFPSIDSAVLTPMMDIQSAAGSIPRRPTRHFAVYKQTHLVLLMEDHPGVLISSASPPPSGPPQHPFINAQATDSRYEHDLGRLLGQATSFDDYIRCLIENGYDLRSYDDQETPKTLSGGYRLLQEDNLVGVIWDHPGQFATLTQQPEPGALQFQQATLTVYDPTYANTLLAGLETTETFAALLDHLQSQGLTIADL